MNYTCVITVCSVGEMMQHYTLLVRHVSSCEKQVLASCCVFVNMEHVTPTGQVVLKFYKGTVTKNCQHMPVLLKIANKQTFNVDTEHLSLSCCKCGISVARMHLGC